MSSTACSIMEPILTSRSIIPMGVGSAIMFLLYAIYWVSASPRGFPISMIGGSTHSVPSPNGRSCSHSSPAGSTRGLIQAHWEDAVRLATSVRTGTVPASLMLRRLGSYPRQNGLALALREIGRIERTLFTLDWLDDPGLRRQATAELNKGESRNALARAVCFHRLGRIRDRSYEGQQHRASGLTLSRFMIC